MARPSQAKLSGLELVRFGAAFAVLIAHYSHLYMQGYGYEGYSFEHQPLFAQLGLFYRYGTRAVEVFWCLSGFIFFFKYGRSIQGKIVPAMRFFWLRFSRLYPLHILTLFAVVGLQWAYHARNGTFFIVEQNNFKHFVLNLLFVQYWGFQQGFSFNAPSWSVSLELLAYLFFFVATRRLGTSLITVILVLAGCATLNLWLGAEPVISRCIFYFYAGGLACLAYQFILQKARLLQIVAGVIGIILVAICTRRFDVTHDVDFILNFEVPVLLVTLALASSLLPHRIALAFDGLGNLTYSSYLLHFPLQILIMLFAGLLGVPRGFADSPIFLGAYILGVFLVSYFVYRWIEIPAQELIRRKFILPLNSSLHSAQTQQGVLVQPVSEA